MAAPRSLERRLARGAAFVTLVAAVASAVLGCGISQRVADGPPVPAGQLGPIVPGEPGHPPVECRGVPLEMCRSMGMVDEANIVRVIVTCTAMCTPARGEVRIDVLLPDGSTRTRGQGSYESAGGAPVPEPAITPPPIPS